MGWLTALLMRIGKVIAPALVCAYFTRERGEQDREKDRLRWWKFAESAKATQTKADDAIAVYLQGRCNFHDSPEVKAHKVMLAQAGVTGIHVP
jgi:hypothetical protein